MTLFKHTEPPIKAGEYHTDIGILYFYPADYETEIRGNWEGSFWTTRNKKIVYPSCWYSPSPPKEIEEIIVRLESGSINTHQAKILLKYLKPI